MMKQIGIGINWGIPRAKEKLTQKQVANQPQSLGSNTKQSTYSRYETGALNIKVSALVRLKEIFHCACDDFFAGL